MRRLRWMLIGAFLASTSCQPEGAGLIESGAPGTLALSIAGAALSSVPPTTWQARITGNGVDLTRSGNPGQSVSLTLNPGSYAVSMAGLAQGGVVLFGERDGLVVTAGGEIQVTVPVTSFVPATVNAPSATTTGQSITVSWAPVPGASSGYEVESSPTSAFTQSVDRMTTMQTSVTMTPAQPGTYHFRVRAQPNGRVSAAGYWSEATAGTVVASAGPPSITTASPLPQGVVGIAYSQALEATGGQAPYTWSIASGSLPAGLTLSGSAVLSGTPSAAGTSAFTVRVTGDDGLESSRPFSLTIEPAPVAPTITTTSPLPPGIAGSAYSQALQATGGQTPYSWAVASGSLPAGLTLSSGGVLSGTPSATGTSTFSVRVTGGDGLNSTAPFTLSISPAPVAPSITTNSSLPPGAVGTPYSLNFRASGGQTPYTWSVASGSLPAGLTLSSGGVLSGTPSTAGTSNFSVRVTGSDGLDGTRSFSLVVDEAELVTLTVQRYSDGSGGVSSDPVGIDIPRGGTVETQLLAVPRGSNVTLTVVDSVGYDTWFVTDEYSPLCPGLGPPVSPPCSFVMNADRTIVVIGYYFDSHVSWHMHGAGSLTNDARSWTSLPQGGHYHEGAAPTLPFFGVFGAYIDVYLPVTTLATPDPGWRFVGWDGACGHAETVCSFLVPRTGQAFLAGYFEPVPYGTYSVDDLWPSFDQPMDFEFAVPAGSTQVQVGEVTFNLAPRRGIAPITYGTSSASWLTLEEVGVQGGQVTARVQASPAGLATGTHVATARLWSYRARESYRDVTVTLRILP